MPPPNALRLVLWITLSASLLGAFFAYAENRPLGIADFVNTELHGALAGGLNGGILSSFEIFVLRGAKGASLRQLPFLPYLALRSLLYLGIILLVLIASNLPVGISRADVVFSLAASLGYNLLLGVNDLLGPGVLFAFVAGRYYHPRLEERVLLFIDMRASTAIAERLGEVRFLDFSTVSSPTCRSPSPRQAAKSTSMSATRSSPLGRSRRA
jgi:adenylate cyclase